MFHGGWEWCNMNLSELSFRSAAVSREESAVLLAEADSSRLKAFGMTVANGND